MTLIVFYNHQIRDVVAPSRSLCLQAGRGGNPERFWLSNGSKSVFLDAGQASNLLGALDKINRCVQRGRLVDHSFYSYDIEGADGGTLGVDLGVLAGRPYIGIENVRVDIGPEDLAYFAAACRQAQFLCGGVGIAGKVAQVRTPPGQRVIGYDEFEYQRRGYE
jgi:hypothetical protein